MRVCFVCVCFLCLYVLYVLYVWCVFVLFVLCVLLTPSFSSIYISLYILFIYPESTRAGWGSRCIYPWLFAACVVVCVGVAAFVCDGAVWRGEWVVCVCRGG